jgi:glycosyltransferase involved in cell wall biosynthesis
MRFLLACFETPGWGGAGTFTYTLFERMQRDGFDVSLINLVDAGDAPMLRDAFGPSFGNPSALDGVETCILERPLFRAHDDFGDRIRSVRLDLMVVCGFVGAWLMKHAAPELPMALFTSGAWQVKRLLREGAITDFVEFQRHIERGVTFALPKSDKELRAVILSDLIFLHSPLVRTAFEHFYPTLMGKVYANLISIADCVYAEAERFADCALPFAQRDIDAIFIASNWRRPEKNLPLLRRIAADCADLRLHVVGAGDADHLPVNWHGVVARREDLYALLGRSKAIVCPSAWDPAPGVLFEASAMGCNVVASPNCGNWRLCHEQLLADSPAAFASAIRRGVTAPYADNRELFRGGYADLVETLCAFV